MRHRHNADREPAEVSRAMGSVPRQRAFLMSESCFAAVAAIPVPPPRKVARAYAKPTLRPLPLAHRLASSTGGPPSPILVQHAACHFYW